MYLGHYNLNAKPFDLSPGPRFLWLGEKHKEALSTLTYGIIEDLGFLLLTGDVGVGKTALIYRLISNLDSSTIVAHITDPGLGTVDFFKLLAVEFNIPGEFHSKGPFLIELEKFLYAAYSDHKKVLLIVDEAQRLSNKLLDQIRVLSNIELSDRKLINIFFVGQPEFKKILMANSNRAIRQRIAINYHIQPLTESETGQYIEHRLKVAGASRKIFKSNSIREIFGFTGGYPRAINVLCDHALLTGYASGIKTIDSDVIKECERELNIRAGFDFSGSAIRPSRDTARPETHQSPPPRSVSMGIPILIGLFMVLGTMVSYYFLWPAYLRTKTPDTQTELADASDQQTGTAGKDPSGTASEKAIALPQPNRVDDGQGNQGPKDRTDVNVRPPAIVKSQASPDPGPLPDKGEVDGNGTLTGQAEKESASLSSPMDATVVAEPEAEAATETDPSTDTPSVDGPVTAAGKAAAAVVAVLTAEPGPSVDPAPRKEAVDQDTPPTRETDPGAYGQPATPAVQAATESAPSPDTPKVETDAATAGKAVADHTVLAVLAAEPRSAASLGTSVGNTGAEPAAKASKPVNTRSRRAAESQRPAAAAPSNAAIEKTTPTEAPPPGNRPDASLTARADTQLQTSSEASGRTAAMAAQLDPIDLENRLRTFLQTYCSTYAAKDLDRFIEFFSTDAMENGKPFDSLVPKYERNFEFIETIQYRIELQEVKVTEDQQTINIDGDFFLKWLPPDKQWRENSGKISMRLIEDGSSFLVQRLDYQGGRSK